MRHWKLGEVTDLHPEMLELALRIVGKCLFDLDDFGDLPAMESAVERVHGVHAAVVSAVFGADSAASHPGDAAAAAWQALPGRADLRMIAERRRDPTDRGDLLSMLLNATDPEAAMARPLR